MTRCVNAVDRRSKLTSPGLIAFLSVATAFASQPQGSTSQSALVCRQASTMLANHNLPAAEHLLDTFLSKYAEEPEALALLAQVRVEQGDAAAAKKLLLKALNISPNSPPANDTLGAMLLSEHHAPEAMDRFETALAINLNDKTARNGEVKAAMELVISARKADRPDAALEALEHARTKLPDDPELLLDLGMLASEMGHIDEAMDAIIEAKKLEPQNLDVVYALARVEQMQQHVPAAESDLRAYLAKRPNDASAHFGLGMLLSMQQKTAEARVEFQRSIQLQPLQTESYYELGQLELESDRNPQAESLFQKVLTRNPKHGGALTGMGILAFHRKDYQQSEQFLHTAEDATPDYQPAHYYRGLALAKLGQAEESKRELQLAIDLDRKQGGPPAALPVDASVGAIEQ